MRRPTDLAAIGITLAASMLVVQATWTPPLVSPAEAEAHVGQRIRMQGLVMDPIAWDDGSGRFLLVADGAAVHARHEGLEVPADAWIEAVATVDRDGGRPLLRVESIAAARWVDQPVHGVADVAREPDGFTDRLIRLQGHLEGSAIEDAGHRIETTQRGDGAAALDGVLRYEPRCACYRFHVAQPWTPSSS